MDINYKGAWVACMLGINLAACGAINDQGYDSEDNAVTTLDEPIGHLAANGLRIVNDVQEVFAINATL
ncbi:MAG: hypothetical protein H6715_03920 [Myxococcales bacterium]|nr:hypothetical protein [Myxococcales bacterium]MCB9708650.1 hypothetical protein [Myxococcales bacterium]